TDEMAVDGDLRVVLPALLLARQPEAMQEATRTGSVDDRGGANGRPPAVAVAHHDAVDAAVASTCHVLGGCMHELRAPFDRGVEQQLVEVLPPQLPRPGLLAGAVLEHVDGGHTERVLAVGPDDERPALDGVPLREERVAEAEAAQQLPRGAGDRLADVEAGEVVALDDDAVEAGLAQAQRRRGACGPAAHDHDGVAHHAMPASRSTRAASAAIGSLADGGKWAKSY